MKNKRILIIDDDKDHLDLCKWILQRNGYEVTTLSHSTRIMEIAASFKPDLIFMDHHMPDGNGTEATRLIKSHPDTKDIRVIYFSSCDDIIKRSEEAGADAYLEKPFRFEKFIEIVTKIFLKK